jgi:hypothetical protein
MIRFAFGLITIITLSIAIIMPVHSIMTMDFKVDGEQSTMTSYTYLKQSKLENSGYTRGLKDGSFNYLVNGTISLKEYIQYNPGSTLNETNSSVEHRMDLSFNGEKGISEFFGKQYFESNIAVSAWKKIYYVDLNYSFNRKTGKSVGIIPLNGGDRINGSLKDPFRSTEPVIRLGSSDARNYSPVYRMLDAKGREIIHEKSYGKKESSISDSYILGGNFPANNFVVNASLFMDMKRGGTGYQFYYRANASNAVIETKDSWSRTNTTRGKNIEWEQEALLRGKKINITNNLIETGDYITGPLAPEDWLPCCFADAKHPPIEGLDSGWPSSGTNGTLMPTKLLPNCAECKELCKTRICDNCSPEMMQKCSGCTECKNNCAKRCLSRPQDKNCLSNCTDICNRTACSSCSSERCNECQKCSGECLKDCNWSCVINDCTGYECINTDAEGVEENSAESRSNIVRKSGIYGTQRFSNKGIGQVTYTVTVKNTGDVKLTNITLVDILPLNITFDHKNDSIKLADGKLVSDYTLSDEGPHKMITLSLGELDTGKSSVKSVKIDAHFSPSARANPQDNTIKLTAKALGQDVKPFESKGATIDRPL